MDNGPLVTVGIPVYNGEDDLPLAVESIVTQTYSNLEIIISDNASTDRTQQVALELASRDARVRYFRQEKNLGANGNFERLRQLARGQFFMWTGSDDLRPPDAIRLLVDALTKHPQAVMAHGAIIAHKPGEFEQHIPNTMDLSSIDCVERIRSLTRGMRHIAMEYGLFRLSTLREATFEYPAIDGPFGRYGDDYLICLQMCFMGPVEYVSSPMIVYRMRNVPPDSPMGEDIPLTASHLLHGTRRMWKSWSVLIFGCYYLLRFEQYSIGRKVTAALVHVSSFVVRYKKRLAADFVLIASSTILAFPLAVVRSLRRPLGFLHSGQ